MKITYISYSTIPSRTANSIHVMKMCSAMAELGHDVNLIHPAGNEDIEAIDGSIFEYYGVKPLFTLNSINISSSKLGRILYLFNILRILIFSRPDAVVGRYCFGCLISAALNIKTIFESHKPYNEFGKNETMALRLMVKLPSFKNLVVISDALKLMFLKYSFIKPSVILTLHDAADIVDSNICSSIQLLGERKLQLGYIGHLYRGRGIDLLIELSKRCSDVNIHIVGGTECDIKYWKKYIDDMNISNIFFYGHVTPKKSAMYRASFDVLLAPYSQRVSVAGNLGDTSAYMSPLKIFEYMSHAKPIVCSDIPVLREVLNDDNSILVDPTNIDEWAEAVNVLRDERVRSKLGARALKDFRESYTWKGRAERMIRCYAR